ncbi:hypothetical protein BDQ17DRAFT_1324336 [Cyathus striatus]|nr:hypothetical protein BDQ17DRAFT_1324336 [Cyathus striatus]
MDYRASSCSGVNSAAVFLASSRGQIGVMRTGEMIQWVQHKLFMLEPEVPIDYNTNTGLRPLPTEAACQVMPFLYNTHRIVRPVVYGINGGNVTVEINFELRANSLCPIITSILPSPILVSHLNNNMNKTLNNHNANIQYTKKHHAVRNRKKPYTTLLDINTPHVQL